LVGIDVPDVCRRRFDGFGCKPVNVIKTGLGLLFETSARGRVWITDIIGTRIHQNWLYLCVVIHLFPRRVVGWPAQSRRDMNLILQAALMGHPLAAMACI